MMDRRLITSPYEPARGMGQVSISSDISQWGIGEWAAVLIGGYLAVKLVADTKLLGGKVISKTRRGKRKVARAPKSGTSTIGTVVTVGALTAASYLGYELYTNSQTAATQ